MSCMMISREARFDGLSPLQCTLVICGEQPHLLSSISGIGNGGLHSASPDYTLTDQLVMR